MVLTMAVTIFSTNAKGLNSPFKQLLLWKETNKQKADSSYVQETHSKNVSPIRLHNNKFPHIYLTNSEKKSAGVLVAIIDSVSFKLLNSRLDSRGRFIILVCSIKNLICTLVNIYAPISFLFYEDLYKKTRK